MTPESAQAEPKEGEISQNHAGHATLQGLIKEKHPAAYPILSFKDRNNLIFPITEVIPKLMAVCYLIADLLPKIQSPYQNLNSIHQSALVLSCLYLFLDHTEDCLYQ